MDPAVNADVLRVAPAGAPRFFSDDVDEVRAYMDGHTGAHWRRALGTRPLGFDMAVLGSGRARVAWFRCAGDQAVRGSVPDATLQLAFGGEATYRVGRRDVAVAPGNAMLLMPGSDVTIVTRDIHRFLVAVPWKCLERESLARGPGEPRELPAVAARLAIDAGAAAVLAALVSGWARSAMKGAAAAARGEARLTSWIADRLDRPPSGRRTPALADARVREVEAWIDAHLHHPVTLGRLCEVAGVGARCLQIAFEKRRGISPLGFVAQRRLEAAHRRLVSGDEGSVTAVALALGIEHLGRFAIAYRRLYGLSPSETLALARRG